MLCFLVIHFVHYRRANIIYIVRKYKGKFKIVFIVFVNYCELWCYESCVHCKCLYSGVLEYI